MIILFILVTILFNNYSQSIFFNTSSLFKKYHTYDEIVRYLYYLEETYPNIARVISIGDSYEGRMIPLLKISTTPQINQKSIIFIDAGIHAREWITEAVILYFVHKVMEKEKYKKLYEKVDWYIVPVLNPDGYVYTHTKDRFWRKTRSKGKICDGADPNRNFDFHWNEANTDEDECSEIYPGKYPFSEPETQRLRDITKLHKDRIKLYVTLHSYGKYVLYPWSYAKIRAKNYNEHHVLGRNIVRAINRAHGTVYSFGSSAYLMYPISGVSDDWMKGVLKIPHVLTIELAEGGENGFDPTIKQMKRIIKETFPAFIEMHKFVLKKLGL